MCVFQNLLSHAILRQCPQGKYYYLHYKQEDLSLREGKRVSCFHRARSWHRDPFLFHSHLFFWAISVTSHSEGILGWWWRMRRWRSLLQVRAGRRRWRCTLLPWGVVRKGTRWRSKIPSALDYPVQTGSIAGGNSCSRGHGCPVKLLHWSC